ncbi:hypothetical protein POKO110462_05250 [Pontibacter korlensis]|uniref:Lipoprotein n=1 Tax=Pontibacter korlensis TaxID=400092 RepID=A0A0E3UX78_9BACT|nr:hypothetical protein [Pontibacter korlensis]AKD03366.1 hypothetical protein PKOR_09825 [Pontibacter korlensis]
MKIKLIKSITSAVFAGSLLLLTSCGGNNGSMPPESTTGDTNETGVQGSGDLPGTGDDETHVNDALAGEDTTGIKQDTSNTNQ